MKFFYGSNDGVDKLNWDYLFETFTEKNFFEDSNPEGNKKAAISFLEKNNLLMSDVIETTNRHDKFKKNDDLKNIISKNPEIILYFTAKYDLKDTYNIFSIFCKIFDGEISIKNKKAVGKKVWALEIEIHKKTIKVFFLPTIRGTRVDNSIVANFLNKHNSILYKSVKSKSSKKRTLKEDKELSELYHKFRIEAYQQAFVKKNLDYDGSNPI